MRNNQEAFKLDRNLPRLPTKIEELILYTCRDKAEEIMKNILGEERDGAPR